MHKAVTPVVTVLLISAVAFLAIYGMGALERDGASHVDYLEYGSNEFTFSGEVKDGLFSGNGTVSLYNGGVFTGSFDEGRFSGYGAFYNRGDTILNDWHFDGVFQNGRTSSGTFYFADDSEIVINRDSYDVTLTGPAWQYSGGLNERGQNGKGSFVFKDGSVYNGSFLNGLADGVGIYFDAEGRVVYEGDFRNGLFNGRGTYFSSDGWSYEGGFKDGLFDGEGTVTDGDNIHSGVWREGVQIESDE